MPNNLTQQQRDILAEIEDIKRSTLPNKDAALRLLAKRLVKLEEIDVSLPRKAPKDSRPGSRSPAFGDWHRDGEERRS